MRDRRDERQKRGDTEEIVLPPVTVWKNEIGKREGRRGNETEKPKNSGCVFGITQLESHVKL